MKRKTVKRNKHGGGLKKILKTLRRYNCRRSRRRTCDLSDLQDNILELFVDQGFDTLQIHAALNTIDETNMTYNEKKLLYEIIENWAKAQKSISEDRLSPYSMYRYIVSFFKFWKQTIDEYISFEDYLVNVKLLMVPVWPYGPQVLNDQAIIIPGSDTFVGRLNVLVDILSRQHATLSRSRSPSQTKSKRRSPKKTRSQSPRKTTRKTRSRSPSRSLSRPRLLVPNKY